MYGPTLTPVDFAVESIPPDPTDTEIYFAKWAAAGGTLSETEQERALEFFTARTADTFAPDFYVDAVDGDDGNDGLTEVTAKQTLAADYVQLKAAASGSTLGILAGTYKAGFSYNGSNIYNIVCLETATIDFEGTNDAGGLDSAFDVGGTSEVRIYGRDLLTIANTPNNGLGCTTNGVLRAADTTISGCFDGWSGHSTAHTTVIGLTITATGKSAYHHANSATSYAADSSFTTTGTPTVNIRNELGKSVIHNCILNVSGSTTGSINTPRTYFTNCILRGFLSAGTKSMDGITNASFIDCYFNNIHAQNLHGTTITRCYGQFTLRPRGATGNPNTIQNSVFTDAINARVIDGDFYNGTTDVYGQTTLKDCILFNATTAVYRADGTAPGIAAFNANWTLQNNCLYNNTANYSSGITVDGTDVTGQNPLIINTSSEDQDDWRVYSDSPCVGAGTGGGNIGLGVSSEASP